MCHGRPVNIDEAVTQVGLMRVHLETSVRCEVFHLSPEGLVFGNEDTVSWFPANGNQRKIPDPVILSPAVALSHVVCKELQWLESVSFSACSRCNSIVDFSGDTCSWRISA